MRAARAIVWTVAVPTWLWACAALALFPHWAAPTRVGALLLFIALTVVMLAKASRLWRGSALLGSALGVVALWSTVAPAVDRTWATGQERAPTAAFSGDEVTIHNVRHAQWRSPSDVSVTWETRRYDLRALRSVDLVVEPFEDWRGPAHIFVTFGLEDGETVAISIEARREAGERYSLLRGAFRNYELLYVVGDERDLIGMRANIRKDPVYVFPTRASPEAARRLFVAMVERAQELAVRPEFYHSVTSTCATNLLAHVNAVRGERANPFDWRILLPGYADELAWDLGWIDFAGSLEEARARFLINARAAWDPAVDGRTWSRKIRHADDTSDPAGKAP